MGETTQQNEFVSQVLTALFHHSPEQFLHYLSRDGNKLLRFYWDEAGKKLPESQRSSFFGMNYEFRKPHPLVTVALIRLPEPKTAHEAHFAALVYRPARATPFMLVRDPTKILALEHMPGDDPLPKTLLVEWDRRMQRIEIGPGPSPVYEDFFQAVLGQLEETGTR